MGHTMSTLKTNTLLQKDKGEKKMIPKDEQQIYLRELKAAIQDIVFAIAKYQGLSSLKEFRAGLTDELIQETLGGYSQQEYGFAVVSIDTAIASIDVANMDNIRNVAGVKR